jgi:hypothetical protein
MRIYGGFMRARIKIFVLLTSFMMTVPLCMNSANAGSTPEKALILHLEGTVQEKAPGNDEWKVLKKGDWLAQGTTVQTAGGSSCEIGIGDNHKSAVHMKEDSQAVMDSLDPAKIRVGLRQGRLFAWVRGMKEGSKFEVASPTAVATARGTGWEQTKDSLHVFESSVDVVGAGGEEMLVEAGKGIEIAEDGDLGDVFELPVEARNEWNNVQESVDKHVTEETNLPVEPSTDNKGNVAEVAETRAAEEPVLPAESTTENKEGEGSLADSEVLDRLETQASPEEPLTTEDVTEKNSESNFEEFESAFESPERAFEETGTASTADNIANEVDEQTSQAKDQELIQTELLGSTLDPNRCFSQGGTDTSC